MPTSLQDLLRLTLFFSCITQHQPHAFAQALFFWHQGPHSTPCTAQVVALGRLRDRNDVEAVLGVLTSKVLEVGGSRVRVGAVLLHAQDAPSLGFPAACFEPGHLLPHAVEDATAHGDLLPVLYRVYIHIFEYHGHARHISRSGAPLGHTLRGEGPDADLAVEAALGAGLGHTGELAEVLGLDRHHPPGYVGC